MLSADALARAGDDIVALLTDDPSSRLSAFDIEQYVDDVLREGRYAVREGNYVHPTAQVHPTAIVERSIILAGAKVHEFVSVRHSILLPNARVGHGGEVARSILGPEVSLPRFNYVGSGIIGARVRLGGCVSVASRRFDDAEVHLQDEFDSEPTGRTKFGAIVGEDTIVGFGVHINPGLTIGRRCLISPLVDLRVSIPDDQIVLSGQRLHLRPRPGRFGR